MASVNVFDQMAAAMLLAGLIASAVLVCAALIIALIMAIFR